MKSGWQKSEIEVSTGLVFLEASVLGLLMAAFSLCLHGSLAGYSPWGPKRVVYNLGLNNSSRCVQSALYLGPQKMLSKSL